MKKTMSIDKLQFDQLGFLVVKKFFDIDTEIVPIQNDIKTIIELVCKQNNVIFRNTGKWYDGY